MNLFLNPKNMGEIKNADGVGKVGNKVCVLPGEKIHLNEGVEQIKDISSGNLVLDHNAEFNIVSKIFRRKINSDIIYVKNKLGIAGLTPDHLVFAIKVPKKRKFFDTKVKKTLVPAWYHVRDLEKRDVILYPISKKVEDIKYLEIRMKKPKYDFRSKEVPKRIRVDGNFLRLAGYYLSEGDLQEEPCRTYISLTFGIGEEKYALDVKKIVKKVFGIDVKIKKKPNRNTIIVFIYNTHITRFFKALFGRGALHKRLPASMLHLPLKKQKELIKGLWRGDGYFSTKRIWPRAGYSTISPQLVQQLKILLLRQKIVTSIYVEQEKITHGTRHQKSYRIHIGDRNSLRILAKIIGSSFNYKRDEKVHSWFDKNYFYTPITQITKRKYNGIVLNLEVDKSHSYVHEAFCLHNCGDVMYVYIRVGNKRGKEIIKNIKFKALGCVAAIATSSMITELAKGKTLEQAEKITRGDIAKSLEGLPPVKMHCSNLAADALHAAIKDYYSKK